MDDWVADLTCRLLGADSIAAAQAAFRHLAEQAGVTRFAYGRLSPRRGFYVDSSYPQAWLEHYLAHGYQEFDPVVLESRRSRLPFAWRYVTNRPSMTEEQRRLFDEAADFGLRDGLTMPFHGTGEGLGVLSLAFENTDRMRDVMAAQPRMRLLGIYYNTSVERLLEDDEAGDGWLAPHERQCLCRLADGQSLWDISAAMHLPETAVTAILRQVRERFSATSVAEVVAKATAQGLI
jgi:DNA-binding CsgD family transcriptional regulator